ncbi:hypothetical protein [Alicyclobacillus cellulosilyticus]|nr:hypothetical protein [Alicyclobacillus cellulosilyticus]
MWAQAPATAAGGSPAVAWSLGLSIASLAVSLVALGVAGVRRRR